MIAISKDKAVSRYLRAAKERGVKILFLHPFFDKFHSADIVAYNMAYFSEISSGLKKMGVVQEHIVTLPVELFQPAVFWEKISLSIGVFIAFIWLLNCFFLLRPRHLVALVVFAVVFFYICLGLGMETVWYGCIALLAATTFPSLAVISQFPDEMQIAKAGSYRWVWAGVYMFKIIGLSLLGAVFVVGLLSDVTYLFNITYFFGVKTAFLLPVLLVGLYFFLRPHRVSSMFYVFKRLFLAPIRTSSLLALVFCLAIVVIYILRSGNYFSFQVPFVEAGMREILEKVLFIRPRTKEFLIGYPFLLLAFLYADKGISRKWLWFFNSIGVVALISVVNSFCHFHTPVMISVYRSVLGLLLGVAVGVAYVLFIKLFKQVSKFLT